MTEQELRVLVREAIARHTGGMASHGALTHGAPAHPAHLHTAPLHDFSHGMFVLPTGSDSDGPCVIEPTVMCNHCGYCKSYGH